MAKERESVWLRCFECGGGFRDHTVLHDEPRQFTDEDGHPEYVEHHQLVECMGCKTIRYRRFTLYNHPATGEPYTEDEHVFPGDDSFPGKRQPASFGDEEERIPATVWKMYKETITCTNARARTLAGGGLRATVEAICREQGIDKGNLMEKIDELVNRKLLTESQAAFLHEERFIGNAALHELETPSTEDIELGLSIVEGLMNTIYVLPVKANELKKRREAKKAPPKKK